MKISTEDIKKLIKRRYTNINWAGKNNEWVVLSEVRTNTGFRSKFSVGKVFTEKHIDMVAFNCWPSKGYLRVAFEIKISRNDFLMELKHPEKRWLAMMYFNQFYFVVVKGVVAKDKLGELPKGCGLIEVSDKLTLRTVWEAPIREASPLPDSFIVSLLRNACKRKSK